MLYESPSVRNYIIFWRTEWQTDGRKCLRGVTCWVFTLLCSTQRIPSRTPNVFNNTDGINRIYFYLLFSVPNKCPFVCPDRRSQKDQTHDGQTFFSWKIGIYCINPWPFDSYYITSWNKNTRVIFDIAYAFCRRQLAKWMRTIRLIQLYSTRALQVVTLLTNREYISRSQD